MSREKWDQKDWSSQEIEHWLLTRINYAIYKDHTEAAARYMAMLIANRQLQSVQSIDYELQMRRQNGV